MNEKRRNVPVPKFTPQRLALARRRRGLTKTKLAELVEVKPRMVVAYEQGQKFPSEVTLDRMVQILEFPRAFFEADELDELPALGMNFRALSKLTARERGKVSAIGAFAMALSDWIEQRFRLPVPDLPQYRGLKPEAAAAALRDQWGIGERPVHHVIQAVEAHGVRVFVLPHECESVDAFSFTRGHTPFIFLNTRKSAERTRMDVAHELGHLVLHSGRNAQGRKNEREAAQFASAFLMSRNSVCARAPYSGTLDEIVEAKHYWRVSAAALTYRMHEVEMLSDWQYHTLFSQMSREGYRTNEPQPAEPETSVVLDTVFRSLRDEGLRYRDVAKELLINTDELSGLIAGLVRLPVSAPPSGRTELNRFPSPTDPSLELRNSRY